MISLVIHVLNVSKVPGGTKAVMTPTSDGDGVNWYHWRGDYYSLQKTEMKIRP